MPATFMLTASFKACSAPPRRTRRERTTKIRATSHMAGKDKQPIFTRRDALATSLVSSLGPLAIQILSPTAAGAAEFNPEEKNFSGVWESVCSYNVINFPSGGSPCTSFEKTREDELAYTLKSIGLPSLLFFQEITTKNSLELLEEVLKSVNPAYATAVQPENLNTRLQLDVITVYDESVFEYLPLPSSTEFVNGGVGTRRDMIIKKFKHKGTNKEFLTVNAHLKANDKPKSEKKREEEAKILKAKLEELSDTPSYIIAGDLNIYSNREKSYEILAGERGRPGIAVDPVDPGHTIFNGKFNSSHYAIYHTQSTRGKGCGSLDDRFDMMLVSRDFLDAGVGSYSAICNDGQHYNADIIAKKNGCDPTGVLPKALFLLSDHLPVKMQLNFA